MLLLLFVARGLEWGNCLHVACRSLVGPPLGWADQHGGFTRKAGPAKSSTAPNRKQCGDAGTQTLALFIQGEMARCCRNRALFFRGLRPENSDENDLSSSSASAALRKHSSTQAASHTVLSRSLATPDPMTSLLHISQLSSDPVRNTPLRSKVGMTLLDPFDAGVARANTQAPNSQRSSLSVVLFVENILKLN